MKLCRWIVISLFLLVDISRTLSLDQRLCAFQADNYILEWAYEPITKNVVFLLKVNNASENFWTGVGIGKRNLEPIDFIGIFVRNGQLGIADTHINSNGALTPDPSTNVQSISFDLTNHILTAKFARALNSSDKNDDHDLSGCSTFYFPTKGGVISPAGITPDFNVIQEMAVCDIDKNCVVDMKKKIQALSSMHKGDQEFRRDDLVVAHSVDISGTGDPCSFSGINYTVDWTYNSDKDTVDFVMRTQIKEGKWWSAIGIGDNMRDMDIGIIFVEDGNVRRVNDYFSNSYDTPAKDSLQDWKLDRKKTKKIDDNGLEIYFSRRLDTDDIEKDRTLSGCVLFQFAANLGRYDSNYTVEKHEDWPDLYKACDLKTKCIESSMQKRQNNRNGNGNAAERRRTTTPIPEIGESVDATNVNVENEETGSRQGGQGGRNNQNQNRRRTTTHSPTNDLNEATSEGSNFTETIQAGEPNPLETNILGNAGLPETPNAGFGNPNIGTFENVGSTEGGQSPTTTVFGLNPIFGIELNTSSSETSISIGETTTGGLLIIEELTTTMSGEPSNSMSNETTILTAVDGISTTALLSGNESTPSSIVANQMFEFEDFIQTTTGTPLLPGVDILHNDNLTETVQPSLTPSDIPQTNNSAEGNLEAVFGSENTTILSEEVTTVISGEEHAVETTTTTILGEITTTLAGGISIGETTTALFGEESTVSTLLAGETTTSATIGLVLGTNDSIAALEDISTTQSLPVENAGLTPLNIIPGIVLGETTVTTVGLETMENAESTRTMGPFENIFSQLSNGASTTENSAREEEETTRRERTGRTQRTRTTRTTNEILDELTSTTTITVALIEETTPTVTTPEIVEETTTSTRGETETLIDLEKRTTSEAMTEETTTRIFENEGVTTRLAEVVVTRGETTVRQILEENTTPRSIFDLIEDSGMSVSMATQRAETDEQTNSATSTSRTETVEGSGEGNNANPSRAEAESTRTGGSSNSGSMRNNEAEIGTSTNNNAGGEFETGVDDRPSGISINNGSQTIMAVSGQPANLTSCSTRNGDALPICQKYMDDYLNRVKAWAESHKEKFEDQYPKACSLLANVQHVPTMCCESFWKTCTGYLSEQSLASISRNKRNFSKKNSMGRS